MFDPSCPHNQRGYLCGLSWCWRTCPCRGREDKKARRLGIDAGIRGVLGDHIPQKTYQLGDKSYSWSFNQLELGFGSSGEQRHRNWHFPLLPLSSGKMLIFILSFIHYSLLASKWACIWFYSSSWILSKIPSFSRLLISYINHLVGEELEAQGSDSPCRNGARTVFYRPRYMAIASKDRICEAGEGT